MNEWNSHEKGIQFRVVEQADLAANEHEQPGKVRPVEAVPNCRPEVVAAELRRETAKAPFETAKIGVLRAQWCRISSDVRMR
ncbi:hypothetical protein PRIPAC_79165 [Pristionchus pacificus]|uniref:Uncharacterized protein n=1 Tax=Pristionchus pacificus TaxID=54126 RepID=A0A2A6BI36_PRIPA|nr:hypothetical protein PRIPAC_79165 [Pristionchus pacificus]|eukprot:PDM65585.1 hypothetical protein PRIPAC_52527 [Pristionchus pacificus]